MNKYMAVINLVGALMSVVNLVKEPDGSWRALVSSVAIIITSWGFVISLVAAIKENQ